MFRFCTDGSVEEKVIEKAYKKLALDALVIQQGRLQENQKNLNKDELLSMVRYGADKIFDGAGTGSTITDDDIETIIAKGADETKLLNEKMAGFTDKALKFSMDADASLYEFDDKDEKEDKQFEGIDMKAVISAGWIDPPKRERKKNYNESDYYRDVMAQGPRPSKATGPRILKLQNMSDFQFYDVPRITALYNKDVARKQFDWQRARTAEELEQRRAAGAAPGEIHRPAAPERRRAHRVREPPQRRLQ